jgi:Na+/melibiose symporter-like transporter
MWRAGGRPSPSRPPRRRLWGTRPGRLGVFTVIAGAFVGFLITAVAGREPGFILGLLVVVATAVAVFAVRPKAVYLVIPAPALAYVVAAVLAGYLHDRAADTSHTALVISAVQWIASGFVAMIAATALAVVVAVGRWTASNRRTGLRYGGTSARHADGTLSKSAGGDPGSPASLSQSARRRRG